MKRLLYILAFLPTLALGQYDFETRYFTIDAKALPEMPELSSFTYDFGEKRSFKKMQITDFNKVTANNYWQAVDMVTVMKSESNFAGQPSVNIPTLNQKEFGFSFSVNGNNSRNGTQNYGVKNTVYQEMRSVYFCARSANALNN